MMVFRQIKEATKAGSAILLTGVTMGGGPSHWAARDHTKAGYKVYATPDAARSFDDDLEQVRESGIRVIGEDEVKGLQDNPQHLELKDFDFEAIRKALGLFGVSLDDLDGLALGVFDHGAAPSGYSDRQFRFDYLAERLKPGMETGAKLSNLAFKRGEIPSKMTRLLAVESSARAIDVPLMVMDTAPAAVLGATLDPVVKSRESNLIANIGNFHTIAFRLKGQLVEGVFEHHTGLIDIQKLDRMLRAFAGGDLTHKEIFDDHGHGSLISNPEPYDLDQEGFNIVATGPRRSLMRESSFRPYFAAPFGDMMLTGCFGLLAAASEVFPDMREVIQKSLTGGSRGDSGKPPWEIN
jgi:uncharacterized protein (DUF1786 family)